MIKCRRSSVTVNNICLLFVICLLAVGVSAAEGQVAHGCNTGVIEDALDEGPGTEFLQSFFFEFSQSDHHIRRVLVDPGFLPDKIRLGFHDKKLDDEYCYDVRINQLFPPGVQVFRTSDTCDGGSCSQPISKPDGDFVFVLVGFDFAFPEGVDHHIDEIAIFETSAEVFVSFNDKNNDDQFDWNLKYGYVPAERIREIGETRGLGDKRVARRIIPKGMAVIRGFRLNFEPGFTSGGDHHLKTMGVQIQLDGKLSVFYADKNGDDEFNWEVRWAILDQ